MRTILIDFTQPKTSVGNIGYVGEHNQTEIVVTPPADLNGDENVTSYRIAFGVGENKVYSEAYPKADTISCLLWQQLTADNTLGIQLEGYDDNGDLIAKSAVVYGFLSPSVDGEDETADFTDPIIADITANTLARHTHNNKAILDEILAPPTVEISDTAVLSNYTPTELNELVVRNALLFYQDIPIVYYNAGVTFDFAYYAVINGTLMLKYKTVSINKSISDTTAFEMSLPVEIATSNNPNNSKWTPAELNQFIAERRPLVYSRLPVIAYNYNSGANTFTFAYISANMTNKVLEYNSLCTVNANKTITIVYTDTITVPKTVNGKKAGATTGAITLQAGDISAASGWSPSADTDLATKKYVDDNASGTPDWSDIQNKPTFATVATSGDYDDLLNKPSIPAAQIQADWNEADNTALDYIKNKPATMPPTAHTHTKSDITDFPSLATVATSGNYNDLLNQPTIPDISGCEVTSNKVTAIDNTSTDTQYPSAKCVYDELQNIPTLPSVTSADEGKVLAVNSSGQWVVIPSWQTIYQPVEYIENTGTQYINTNHKPLSTTRVVIDMAFTETPPSNSSFLNGSTNGTWGFIWGYEGATGKFTTLVNNSYSWSEFATGDTSRHTWDLQNGSQKMDNTQVSTTTFTQTNTVPLYLFARSTNNNPNNYSKTKVYSCKIYESGTLTLDLIPCYNRNSGAIGLYDKVNGSFYTNAGTGTFTKGANV